MLVQKGLDGWCESAVLYVDVTIGELHPPPSCAAALR